MPTIDLPALAQKKMESLKQNIGKLQGNKEQTEAVISQWKEPAYDDSHWPVMLAPKFWEEQSLKDFDGVVWYRKTIVLNAAAAAKEATLDRKSVV